LADVTPLDVIGTPWPPALTAPRARIRASLLARCGQLGLTDAQTRAVMRSRRDPGLTRPEDIRRAFDVAIAEVVS
jgi:hypothetical protein